MPLSLKEKSEIELNQAKVLTENTEAALNVVEHELSQLELKKEKYNYDFGGSVDFKNNYLVFDEPVTDVSRCNYTATFRRWSRMNPGQPLTLELNSPGGEIVEGFALFDELTKLRRDGHHLTIRVRGNACSMAAILLQAADKREIGPTSFIMLHRAAFGAVGSAFEVEDTVELVKRFEETIIKILVQRTGKDRKIWDDFFKQRRDIWFDAEGALEAGLVDEIN